MERWNVWGRTLGGGALERWNVRTFGGRTLGRGSVGTLETSWGENVGAGERWNVGTLGERALGRGSVGTLERLGKNLGAGERWNVETLGKERGSGETLEGGELRDGDDPQVRGDRGLGNSPEVDETSLPSKFGRCFCAGLWLAGSDATGGRFDHVQCRRGF